VIWRAADRVDRQVADLWAVVAVGALALVPYWRTLSSTLPLCPMRSLSGLPCPTCGTTRAVASAVGGRWLDAVLYNPLVTLAAIAFVVIGLAAPAWVRLGGRVPDLRTAPSIRLRIAIASGLAGNWLYLIARGV
jgi:hypothetical protein